MAARRASPSLLSAFLDLLHGLFGFPSHGVPSGASYARAVEERYRKPRRCC